MNYADRPEWHKEQVAAKPPHEDQQSTGAAMRTFASGATRSLDLDKPDFEGYLSPLAVEGYGRYMLKHQQTAIGGRTSDNWQKGIPMHEFIKSMFRHFLAIWKLYRAINSGRECWGSLSCAAMRENVYGLFFNVQGFAHEFELLEERMRPVADAKARLPLNGR
jgi:hypothetical protein